MEKEFIPYEQALALKELGFDETSLGFYYDEKGDVFHNSLVLSYLIAPLYQQVFRWFREKYNLESHIKKDWQDGICLGYESMIECEDGIIDCGTYNIYEDAELECLKKLIEIVKEKL